MKCLERDVPDYEQVKKLKYVRMVLNETLDCGRQLRRFPVYAKEDTMLDGKYNVKKDDVFSLLIPELHRDPSV